MDRNLTVPHRVVTLPNAPHTTATPLHSQVWRMVLAHVFLGRPLSTVDGVTHRTGPGGFVVTARVSGDATVRQVTAYYTTQSDTTIEAWDEFQSVPMVESGGVYEASIPAQATAYFVQVADEADGVRGIVSSPPMPVNRDYPYLDLDPGPVSGLQAELGDGGLSLSWTNPTTTDLAGVLVMRKAGSPPADPTDGEAICAGLVETCRDEGFAAGTGLAYAVFTFDARGCYSAATGVTP